MLIDRRANRGTEACRENLSSNPGMSIAFSSFTPKSMRFAELGFRVRMLALVPDIGWSDDHHTLVLEAGWHCRTESTLMSDIVVGEMVASLEGDNMISEKGGSRPEVEDAQFSLGCSA